MTSSTTPKEKDREIETITQILGKVGLNGLAPADLIDTTAALYSVVDSLQGLPTRIPSIYIDLEGESLSRDGTISILQIYVLPTKHTYLIDIHTLHEEAFTSSGPSGHTLKGILESQDIPKVFFDVRNDSDALYNLFNIRLANIQDLQLMELATRTFPRRRVNSLAKCIEHDGGLSVAERVDWKACKEKGVKLFAPEHGGSYKVFNERPLSMDIIRYCVQDVHYMARLWANYNSKLTTDWRTRVNLASSERVRESHSVNYKPHGEHKALAPEGWFEIGRDRYWRGHKRQYRYRFT